MKVFNSLLVVALISIMLTSCKEKMDSMDIPTPRKNVYGEASLDLGKEELYDKVLGALVGSAIGDAMGASTEMWEREDIQRQYGYIAGLTPTVREESPEGPWGHNLVAGATTDDTRWKYLWVQYANQCQGELSPAHFSKYIVDYYQALVSDLSTAESLRSTDLLDTRITKLDWIKEWARVALAYQEGSEAYYTALSRFYGGEMSCAGMLYTPMFGLLSGNADAAYEIAFEHAIFDIGYARDISGLVSAMCNMAMQTDDLDTILETVTFVDPLDFQDSRLIKRLPYQIAQAAEQSVMAAKELEIEVIEPAVEDDGQVDGEVEVGGASEALVKEDEPLAEEMPAGYLGTDLDWLQQSYLYAELDRTQRAIPFHAGEIWQIAIMALKFGDGDFEMTMQFIVNYGRDNDTVAAVVGMILGARDGYSGLPEPIREEVLKVSKEMMGIDLEAMAKDLVYGV